MGHRGPVNPTLGPYDPRVGTAQHAVACVNLSPGHSHVEAPRSKRYRFGRAHTPAGWWAGL